MSAPDNPRRTAPQTDVDAGAGAGTQTLPNNTPTHPSGPEAEPKARESRFPSPAPVPEEPLTRPRRSRRIGLAQPVEAQLTGDDAAPLSRSERVRLRAVGNRPASAAGANVAPTARNQPAHAPYADRLRRPDDGVATESPAVQIPLPRSGRKRTYGTTISFVLCVLIPSIVVSLYFLVYASNQYAAEFRFTVRDAQSAASGVSGAPGLASLLGGSATPNPTENYMVADYVLSREAVDALEKRLDIRRRYSAPGIDWWARFNNALPDERFVAYWQRMTSSSYDQITGLGVVQVRAFTPEDAFLIGKTLLSLSEQLINEIAARPQKDAVIFAEQELARVQDRLQDIRAQMTSFRNTEQIIDPQSSVVTSNVLLAQSLRADLSALQTQLHSLSGPQLSADSPVSVTLRSRIKATRDQLARVEAEVATARGAGTNNPLSKVVGKFEELDLERQFAQSAVTAAMQTVLQAKANALQQHVYVTAYVTPSLPQSSTYPKRWLASLAATFTFLLVWIVGLLLIRSIAEHIN